jgi:hypothetical protein
MIRHVTFRSLPAVLREIDSHDWTVAITRNVGKAFLEIFGPTGPSETGGTLNTTKLSAARDYQFWSKYPGFIRFG